MLKPNKMEGISKETDVRPINDGQAFLYDLLCDKAVPLVTVRGIAGTGKSLITFLAGYEQFCKKDLYKFLLIYKPIIEVGDRTLGFLPGDLHEKMDPWEAAIYDNFNLILGSNGNESSARTTLESFIQAGKMEISPISFIRGRSLNNAFIIVDEAQNLTPHEVKTLVTRVGKDSKIVLVGDIEQIDTPYLDPTSNGLSKTIELLKNKELAGHVTLVKSERSELAELAARLM